MQEQERCDWCGSDPLYVAYHDSEWGVPVHDSKALFAKLILDGAQAGLSWITILRKRDRYYSAMDGLDPEKMACWTDRRIEKLLLDEGLVRNRLKMFSARQNAQAYLSLEAELGSFADYLWDHVDGEPIVNQFRTMQDLPAQTDLSKQLGKDLKKRGFNFVGPTIVYAFMQAVGLVNDHLVTCFRHDQCRSARTRSD
jgi:DNA-3-methyladenine glycosylase I